MGRHNRPQAGSCRMGYILTGSAADVAAVTDFQDENQKALLFDAVENSENAYPNAINIGIVAQLSAAPRPGIVSKFPDGVGDSDLIVAFQREKLLFRGR